MGNEKNPEALEDRETHADERIYSPSAARNREPILEVLNPYLASDARVFEVASGTGEHGIHMVSVRPDLTWQPSDRSEEALKSIEAWRRHSKLDGFLPPISIDACSDDWPPEEFRAIDVVICINMIHISPWTAGVGVMRGAGRALQPGGVLCLYGPFKQDGEHNAPSNVAFDKQLRATDPAWGIRDIVGVESEASQHGLRLDRIVEMPANNRILILTKS